VFATSNEGLYHALYDVREVAGPFTAADTIAVTPIPLDHGIAPSLGFRFGDIVYLNDVVRVPEESFALMANADTLIVDAMRYRPHPTHAHLDLALEWIERVGPRRAFLTNLHVDMDYAELDRRTPAHVHPCHDGLVIES
jgi:phosphoribosyl 1,2-cyclic phosphate phosphodiesterase